MLAYYSEMYYFIVKQLPPGMAAVAAHSKRGKGMKTIARVLTALAVMFSIATGGSSPPARADSPVPIWTWGDSMDCTNDQTVTECAFRTVLRRVGFTGPDGCIMSSTRFCADIVYDEQVWLWKPVTTWDIAQAVLLGYSQVTLVPEVASSDFSETFANSLYAAAQTRVTKLFDPVTHAYLGVVSNFTKSYPPSISGKAVVGQTLTAKVKRWSPTQANTWQWQRNGVDISGATGYKYKLTAADLGTVITVRLTGSKAGYNSLTKISKATKAVAKGKFTVTVKKPRGTTKVGKVLTARVRVTSGAALTYQWYRNGKAISGETGRTYVLAPSDLGKKLAVKVWATKPGYYSPKAKTSNKTNKIRKGDIGKVTPTIAGTAQAGQVLTVDPGAWKPIGNVTYTYQWYRNGKAIRGATGPSLTLTSADLGKTIKAKVTGKSAGYNTTYRYSPSTSKVVSPPDSDPADPTPSPSVP